MDKKRWFIQCKSDSSLFWSNTCGWISFSKEVTRFSDAEQKRLNLPIDGKWVR